VSATGQAAAALIVTSSSERLAIEGSDPSTASIKAMGVTPAMVIPATVPAAEALLGRATALFEAERRHVTTLRVDKVTQELRPAKA